MNEIGNTIREFHLVYIYNFDETGYCYRRQRDRRLCIKKLEGISKDKFCITVGLTCNGTGTHKMPPWVIGKPDNPHYFRHMNKDMLGAI